MTRFRYVLLAVGFLCLTAIGSNYIIINFTFICMAEDKSDLIQLSNGTYRQRFDYTPQEKSYVLWSVAWGTIVGTFPINWAYVRWGARIPFLLAGILSAVSTILTPISASSSFPLFLAVRFVQGLAFAADFAAVGLITVRWAPLSETGIFLGILTSFTSLSNALTDLVAGFLCTSSLGWRTAFYFHGILTTVFFAFWILTYSDDPQDHPRVGKDELRIIQEGKTDAHIERDNFVPYWDIIKNKTILVVWFNAFTELVAVLGMLAYAPLYFNKVLGYSVGETAVLASIVSIVHLPCKIIFSFLSDCIKTVPEVWKMNVFNTLAVGVPGVICCFLGFLSVPWMAVIGFAFCEGLSGANAVAYYKCGTLHSRQYAHFVLATIQFMKCAALFVTPALVAILLVTDEDVQGWRLFFLINGLFMLIANFLFYCTCTDRPAEFTMITRKNRHIMKVDSASTVTK